MFKLGCQDCFGDPQCCVFYMDLASGGSYGNSTIVGYWPLKPCGPIKSVFVLRERDGGTDGRGLPTHQTINEWRGPSTFTSLKHPPDVPPVYTHASCNQLHLSGDVVAARDYNPNLFPSADRDTLFLCYHPTCVPPTRQGGDVMAIVGSYVQGSGTFQLADPTGFNVDDFVIIYTSDESEGQFSPSKLKTAHLQITAIAGTTITGTPVRCDRDVPDGFTFTNGMFGGRACVVRNAATELTGDASTGVSSDQGESGHFYRLWKRLDNIGSNNPGIVTIGYEPQFEPNLFGTLKYRIETTTTNAAGEAGEPVVYERTWHMRSNATPGGISEVCTFSLGNGPGDVQAVGPTSNVLVETVGQPTGLILGKFPRFEQTSTTSLREITNEPQPGITHISKQVVTIILEKGAVNTPPAGAPTSSGTYYTCCDADVCNNSMSGMVCCVSENRVFGGAAWGTVVERNVCLQLPPAICALVHNYFTQPNEIAICDPIYVNGRYPATLFDPCCRGRGYRPNGDGTCCNGL